ncbi:O-antigen ligase family protein [Gluconobacter sp. Dm-62]|uniref:O-antigen ligase family protein n=1 Tax=Gluconobacter sp. Dm-62 TaxID=2799804 RepID=UPI001B8B7E86|nr:O-antigen ligase family protein [Gluconobacter sp. Dm-62]MBS1103234.1 O-antigen ligase family protein [Gluconobacter sp. Dm-62]
MGLTAMGLIFWPLSLLFFFRKDPQRLLELTLVGGVLQAAAVLVLGGLGLQPSMAPGMMFIAFMGLQLVLGITFPGAMRQIRFCAPLFLAFLWAILGSIIFPRLFEGKVLVWPQKLDEIAVRMPLSPQRGNMTQDAYLVLNLVMFVMTVLFLTRREADPSRLYRAYLIGAMLACVVGFWEMAHRLIGSIPFPKTLFYSNPGWAVLDTQMSGPVPRINSTFTEPAACATFLIGTLYSTVWSTLRGYGGWLTRLMLVMSVLCLLMTTSTTGYIAMLIGLMLLVIYALVSRKRQLFRRLMLFIGAGVLCMGFTTFALAAFAPDVIKGAAAVLLETQEKKQSASYEERTQKDTDSYQLALETYGLGTGWGSNRSSSLLPGFLSTIGVVGILALVVWNGRLFTTIFRTLKAAANEQSLDAWMIEATVTALLGRTIATLISGPVLGTMDFYVLLAVLVSSLVRIQTRKGKTGRA